MLKFKVKKDESGKRADIIVANRLPQYTRSSLKQLFTKSFVSHSGSAIKASHKLQSGQEIKVDNTLLEQSPKQIEIPIIYEDDNVIVMNKPAGVLTHSKGALNTEATVASFIRPKLSDNTLGGNRAGIVHRLDRATSGVIITAKNAQALQWLQRQFSTRQVNKVYRAIVEGVPKPPQAIIDAPIKRNPKKPQTFKVSSGGRQTITSYKVLKILNKSSNSYSLLELNPQTGRTHQLRVHLKYIGHPIVGDRVYGHGGDNLYLHASSLELILPSSQKRKFTAPEPSIFKEFVKDE